MSEAVSRRATPVHVWVVSIFLLLGSVSSLIKAIHPVPPISGAARGFSLLGTLCNIAACIFLLQRKRAAVGFFALSLIFGLISMSITGIAIPSPFHLWQFQLFALIIGLLVLVYAWRVTRD